MRGRIRGLGFVAVITVATLAACANEDEQWKSEVEAAAPAGWEWVGEGEQQNFASADRFCQRSIVAADPRLRAEVTSQMSGSDASVRVSEGDRRAYWNCMEGRGWKAQGR